MPFVSLLTAMVCLSAGAAFAVEPTQPLSQLGRQSWTQENGIPEETITGIVFTQDGYLWASSMNGLIRFDGQRAQVFYPGRLTSCNDNTLMGIAVTPDGSLWAGSTRGCVFRVQPDRFGTFANPRFSAELVKSVPKRPSGSNAIILLQLRRPVSNGAMNADPMGLEIIRPGGVSTLTAMEKPDPAGVVGFRATPTAPLPEGITIRATARSSHDGSLWAHFSDDAVYRLVHASGPMSSASNWRWEKQFGLPQRITAPGQYRNILVTGGKRTSNSNASETTVWVTSNKGLVRWQDGNIRVFGMQDGLPTEDVYSLLEDRHGCLWTGVGRGVARLCGETMDSRVLWAAGEEQAHRLAEDSEGNIWIAGRWGRLMRLATKQFSVVTRAQGLPEARTTGVVEDSSGDLWVSTREFGISRIAGGRVEQTVPVSDGTVISAVAASPSGSGILAASSDGLLQVTRQGGARVLRMVQSAGPEAGTPLQPSTLGTLHRLSSEDILYSDSRRNWRVSWQPRPDGQLDAIPLEGPPQFRQWAVSRSREPGGSGTNGRGTIWGLSYFEGLHTLQGVQYRPVTSKAPNRPERWLSLTLDGDILWIGTTDGLLAYSILENRYLPKAAITDDQIFHIGLDNRDHLWISTRAGLIRLVKSQVLHWMSGSGSVAAVERFGERDGLPTSNFGLVSSASGSTDSQGRIWFPGIKGLVGVDPQKFDQPVPPPTPLLLQVRADQEMMSLDSEISIAPGTRRLELEYGMASAAQRGTQVCRYRMLGFDPDWILCKGDRVAQYTNLEPGDYEFVLQTASSAANWDGPQLRAAIQMRAAFYQTGLFKTSVAFAAVGVIAFFIYFRQIRLVERNSELKEHVRERTRELEAAMESAEAAVKAKSQFLATMSHEIRTPMNGVVGVAQLLRESPLDGDQKELVEVIRTSGESLLAILDGVLDLAKLEAGKMAIERAPVEVRAIAHQVAELFQARAASKGVTILTNVDAEVPGTIIGDPVRIRQVLLNLVGNAVKFTDQGSVTIRVQLGSQQPGENGSTRVRFLVIDTGVGVSPEDLRMLFDDFVQADSSSTRRHSGTGLGLAIVRRLAESMKAKVIAESQLGVGSCFGLDLPLEIGDVESQGGGNRAETSAHSQSDGSLAEPEPSSPLIGLRVLVAEDNAVNRLVAKRMLQKLGCQVATAHDGHEAIEMLTRYPFDAVLMDCHMPGLDGFEVTRNLRARGGRFQSLPVIALTASTTPEDRAKCREAGMDDFLSKPLLLETLRKTLEQIQPSAGVTTTRV